MIRRSLVGLVLATPVALAASAGQADTAGVAIVEIKGALPDAPGPFDWLMSSGEAITLQDHVDLLEKAGGRRDVDAVVVRLKDATLGTTQVEELWRAIQDVKSRGKHVTVFAENFGAAEILLGAAADESIIQKGGAVSFPGLSIESMYFADALAWLGVKADMIQVGDYKGANEAMTRSAPSPQWDQNISNLLDGLYGNMLDHISDGRGLEGESLDAAVREAWWASDVQAVELGLIDASVDLSDLTEHLATSLEASDIEWIDELESGKSSLALDNPFAILRMLTETPSHRASGPTIAVLHIDGAIVDGDSTSGGLFGGASTGSRTIRNAIQDILDEEDIGGVIVRIESPGGSAIASEVIWQGLERLSEHKPVWASVGSMAASGGYYVAMGTDRIYVNPSSIVGSIGVVGGKLAFGGLWDKLHIRTHAWHRGPMAHLLSSQPWTDAERGLVREKMKETYDQFAGHVAASRPGIDLSKTAEGRLFTGVQAIELKMADKVGPLTIAIEDMAREIGYDRYDVMHYPGPKGLHEMLEETFGGMVRSPGVGAPSELAGVVSLLKAAIGDQAWGSIAAQLDAMSLLRQEPVLLTMPQGLIVR